MIRAAIICATLAAPAVADERAAYWAALDVARVEMQTESANFQEMVGSGTYDVSALEDRGWLLRSGAGDAAIAFEAELIATYNHETRICTWGFDSAAFPNLPRTAALAVREHAVANNWPDDSVAPFSGRQGICTGRSLLATSIGDLIFVDALRFGDETLYVGFPNMGLGS